MSMDPADDDASSGIDARVSQRNVLAWWRAAMSANDESSVADLVGLGRTLHAADPQRTIGADVESGPLSG
jgi:hypothetical protein